MQTLLQVERRKVPLRLPGQVVEAQGSAPAPIALGAGPPATSRKGRGIGPVPLEVADRPIPQIRGCPFTRTAPVGFPAEVRGHPSRMRNY